MSVLYIEDNPANIEVLARFCKARTDMVLRWATSGQAGIDSALLEVPDLILLDLHLPDLPGVQVLDELRAEPRTTGVPVVVLSAEASQGSIRRLRRYGVVDYLTKPIDLAALGVLLDSVTGAAQAHATVARMLGPRHFGLDDDHVRWPLP
jgi:CheY-like chemotaxis protein